ncbi:hypothetical protein C8J25_1154 [Sphingomonas faeni]|uniref:Uncharacterized protein n=1 Tax=Sphingomonas faeni TaxID=185950 RepID=A0A2T5TWU0_9SPHN|nr:hypothetical protein [Sphingomonas faeni]PTW43689.1 hypothetical protein C8J25_1154 [Sphingomonas faeni]
MQSRWQWEESYDPLVSQFIAKHFGTSKGIVDLFPYMKDSFKWKDKAVVPPDARVVRKNNNEYHGLERHAKQYHLSAMYQDSYEFWLIAAAWRHQNMNANGFTDDRHRDALAYTIRNACFNRDLAGWQQNGGRLPIPEEYDLTEEMISAQDAMAERQINEEMAAHGMPEPYPEA